MAAERPPIAVPATWRRDALSSFIDDAFRNCVATHVVKSPAFTVLSQIDGIFQQLAENLLNPDDVLAAILLLRSHAAFRGSCRMTVSGQIGEAFPLFRTTLEFALYALHINRKAEAGETWLARHDNPESTRAVRREFTTGNVMATLRGADPDLGAAIEVLYERSIDFGAHPNERASSGATTMNRQPDRVNIEAIYLHDDTVALDHGLKTCAQIGVGALGIFELIFGLRFRILGVDEALRGLRQEL